MPGAHNAELAPLAATLIDTWQRQGRDGFLLTRPEQAAIETRDAEDPACGVRFRMRWMPHREVRGDVAELERRGILDPNRDSRKLYRDPRDPQGRHCFLCPANVRECHPLEELVPLRLAGRGLVAGANFAWIERDHFTVMPTEHVDQVYTADTLAEMLDLHAQTGGRFRVLFNGDGAGASIPWHRHYQITTECLPIESIDPQGLEAYPTPVRRFVAEDGNCPAADDAIRAWLSTDPGQHSLNLLVATRGAKTRVHFFPRDRRRATAPGKGMVGGFEVAGDFVFSAPEERAVFEAPVVETARRILSAVRPE